MPASLFMRIISFALLSMATLLTACSGSSTVNDPFKPTRIVVFGDSMSFISTTAAYTVNDTSTNNWASHLASNYGIGTIVKNAAANALVSDIQTQVNTFGAAYQSGDLVVVSAGYRDIINDASGSTNTAAAKGTAYANLVRTMVSNGAKHIAVANMYDLSKTPAASLSGTGATTATNLAAQNGNSRGNLVAAFNDALKSNLGSSTLTYIGDNVRLLDLEAYYNLVRASPTSYSFIDITTITCNSAGNTVGVGNGQIDSSACGTGTLAQASYNSYVFADAVYPTPAFHRLWGSKAYTDLTARW